MGRTASGVRAIKLKKQNDEVAGFDIIRGGDAWLLVVMENGFAKQTSLKEYKTQSRGGSGIKTAKITSKTGPVIVSSILEDAADEEDLIVISRKGQVIRTSVKSISLLGRATQGVRIMRLEEGDKVASGVCLKD